MQGFERLVPDLFLPALEAALSTRLSHVIRTFPSYINRVYEVRDLDDTAYVAKFYRPGRWTLDALKDEHAFILDCAGDEIPVVPPLRLHQGSTLGDLSGIPFAVFPKRAGRRFDIEALESWQRVGSLLGRLHTVGARRKAPGRISLHPQGVTRQYLVQLLEDGVVESRKQAYRDICLRIIDAVTPRFEGLETLRIHGDFHTGNILERPDTGLLVIDFDDMMNGPAIQDLWLMLPDHFPACKNELSLLLDGYCRFREIDPQSALLIEGLRAMRMIYFAAWCGLQRGDGQFQARFPDWGDEPFWSREIQDLRVQYSNLMDALGESS